MKTTSGDTLLIVLECNPPYTDRRDTPEHVAKSIRIVRNDDDKNFFDNFCQIKRTGNHVAIFISDFKTKAKVLADILFDHLHMICIEGECYPYPYRFLVKLLSQLSSEEKHVALADLLNKAIAKHELLAIKSFGGDMYFPEECNVEFVRGGVMEINN